MKVCFKKLFSTVSFLSFIFMFCSITNALTAEENINPKNSPKLSIVVPVYNVGPYLDETLNSAENQTLKDIEIICINDGSTDNSLEILQNHAAKDERIKIINQENKGASEARNVGLRSAKGQYIYFLDSDDVMAPYAMKKSVDLLEKYKADMLNFDFIRYHYRDSVDLSEYSYKDLPVKVCDFKEGQNPFNTFSTRTVATWSYVYRKLFLTDNKIEFKKDLRSFEDILFTYMCKAHLKRLVKDSNIGYFHRVKRPESLVNANSKIDKRRICRFLMIVHELAINKDKFKFPGSKEFLLKKMFDITYGDISKLGNAEDKVFCAKKAYEEIGKNFVEKYRVKLTEADKKKLNDLRRWSEPPKINQKTEKPKAITKSVTKTRKKPVTRKVTIRSKR